MSESERIDELAPIIAGIGRLTAGGVRAASSAIRSFAGKLAKKKAKEKVKDVAKDKLKDKLKDKATETISKPQEEKPQAVKKEEPVDTSGTQGEDLDFAHTAYKQFGQFLSEKCWPGYEKKGMKTMFGKRYPNCVKKKRKLRETMEQLSEEGLRAWFGNSRSKGGKPGWVQVVSGKPCARQPGQKSTPKCVSSSKRASMTPAQRKSAQRRKRKADPNQRFKSGAAKPTYVPTDKPKRKRR